MCIKKNIVFLSFGKRIDVFMSKKNKHTRKKKKERRLLFNFYIQTDMIREKKMRTYTNTYIYVCKRKTMKKRIRLFFALNIKVIDEEEKAMILMFCFVLFCKSFVIAINQIKDGKLTTTKFKNTHTHC